MTHAAPINCLLAGTAFAAALAVTPPARAADVPALGETWTSACDAQGCSLTGVIEHGKTGPLRDMSIRVALGREGKVQAVTFRLPPEAQADGVLAMTFADVAKDASGSFDMKLVPGATRVLHIETCDPACLVTLPGGVIPAAKGEAEFDVGQAMTAHSLMLMYYFVHGQRVPVASTLSRFKAEYAAAMRRIATP